MRSDDGCFVQPKHIVTLGFANNGCVSMDYVHIIAYYCYNSYDLTQVSNVDKVPVTQNRLPLYYRMYT